MATTQHGQALKVPGASIYYETHGSGPLLLLIPGGPTDAGIYDGLVPSLADRYTVVAYDPRGNSRSTFDAAPVEQSMDVHGDDAARLIESFGAGPAYVFGNSGGAQIGLNLAARHPESVRRLVAHEPPCVQLLPDKSAIMRSTDEIESAYRRDGAGAAMQLFMSMAGLDGAQGPPDPAQMPPEAAEAFARIGGNLDYFFAHGLKPISYYVPDTVSLGSGEVKVIVGVGEETDGQIANRSARALAGLLGIDPVVFPGDHGGFGEHPDKFAKTLDRVLRDA